MTSLETTEPNAVETSPVAAKRSSRRALIVLGMAAFLNTMGFTIIGPVSPFIVQQHLSDPRNLAAVVGWLASSYAICQFIAAPGLGALSDRFGRRPILIICLLGSAIGYLLFGFGGALWIFFLGRIIDGLTGGNFSILFAYVADITEPEERGKLFGRFAAISGIGFIAGPAIGGFMARFGLQTPFFMAAGLVTLNLLLAIFALPESLRPEHRVARIHVWDLNPIKQLGGIFRIKQLRWLLVLGVCYMFPFVIMVSNMGVLMIDHLHWDAARIGLVSLVVGGMDILVQGVLVQRLLPRFGEVRLIVVGLSGVMLGYLALGSVAILASPVALIVGIALFAGFGGLVEPTMAGLTSRAAGAQSQGAVQGGSQALQSLTAIFGPLWAGELYTNAGGASPYASAALIVGVGIFLVLRAAPMLRAQTNNKNR